jgi:hypothetical protein
MPDEYDWQAIFMRERGSGQVTGDGDEVGPGVNELLQL